MAANNQRTIAPQTSMSSHAQMMTAINYPSMNSTSFEQERLSPSSKHDSSPVATPVSSFQSASRHTAEDSSPNNHSSSSAYAPTSSDAELDTSPSRSPRLKLHLTPLQTSADTTVPGRFATPEPTAATKTCPIDSSASTTGSSGSGLKLKLRGIQAALKRRPHSTGSSFPQSGGSLSRKRTSNEATFDDDFDTDSEIDIMPPRKKVVNLTLKKQAVRSSSRTAHNVKEVQEDSDFQEDDAMHDAGDEDSSPTTPKNKLILSTNTLKRSERILDPTIPEHTRLIATATKAGSEFYDSDVDDLPGNVKETNKPHLFRNVKWGSLATDYSNSADFTTEPEFTQFVPGRFERLPDGTASDQKHKLIIKLTDKQNRQRIFLNPPPRDWTNQEAITALNKRTVQQIRRNTSIRFREVVEPYVKEEREWILAHLTEGKPSNGWKRFVGEFNRRFKGKVLGVGGVRRPERSHSSLTKEVERFGEMYSKGEVPKGSLQGVGKKKGVKVE